MTTPSAMQPTSSASSANHVVIAEFLESIGWRSHGDAQWTRLRDALPELLTMLQSAIVPPVVQAPIDFDEWKKSPYTIVLQKSIAEDYVPRHAAPIVATVPSGWKLVPIEPTEEMLATMEMCKGDTIIDTRAFADAVWRDMLYAAPSPTEQASDVRNACSMCDKEGNCISVTATPCQFNRALKSATPADKGNAPVEAKGNKS